MILVVLLYALLASTFVIAKHVVSLGKPFFIIGFRMILAGSTLLTYLWITHRSACQIKKEDRWLFLKTALFHVYLAFIPEFWALQFVSSIKTNIIYSSTPFIAAFLSYVLLHERLTKRKWLGMFLGGCSLIPVFTLSSSSSEVALTYTIAFHDVVLFGAVVSASYAWFLVKQLMVRGYSLPLINGIAMFIGGIGALCTSLLVDGVHEPLIYNWPAFLQAIIVLIFVANILVYNLYGFLLRRYSVTLLALSGLLCPLFGAFFGWFFLAEELSAYHFISLAGIAFALFLFQSE